MRPRPVRKLLAAASFVSVAVLAGVESARADDTPPPRAMSDEMHGYYRSERTIAYVFFGIGAASAAGGTVLLLRDEDFARGLGGSLVAVGALQAVGAAFYAFQVDAEEAHYAALVAKDPAAFKREESEHIHGTTSRFVLYRTAIALAVAGAGVATYGFAAKKDVWKGVGIGVASQALVFFTIDSFGQARARAYEERVNAFAPSVTVGAAPGGFTVGLGGRLE